LETSRLLYSELVLGQLDGLDDLDSVSGYSIVTTHFVVHLVEGTLDRVGSVFLEHVLVTDVSVILKIDTEILRFDLLLTVDLLDLEDLTV
jgi:hypothetical protein